LYNAGFFLLGRQDAKIRQKQKHNFFICSFRCSFALSPFVKAHQEPKENHCSPFVKVHNEQKEKHCSQLVALLLRLHFMQFAIFTVCASFFVPEPSCPFGNLIHTWSWLRNTVVEHHTLLLILQVLGILNVKIGNGG